MQLFSKQRFDKAARSSQAGDSWIFAPDQDSSSGVFPTDSDSRSGSFLPDADRRYSGAGHIRPRHAAEFAAVPEPGRYSGAGHIRPHRSLA